MIFCIKKYNTIQYKVQCTCVVILRARILLSATEQVAYALQHLMTLCINGKIKAKFFLCSIKDCAININGVVETAQGIFDSGTRWRGVGSAH
jgi:hypothetical protein